MKVTVFFLSLLLLSGCSSKEKGKAALSQNDRIKNEVKTEVDSFMTRIAKLDPDGVFKYCADTPDWVTINTDGTSYNLQTYRKAYTDFANSTASYKWALLNQDFYLISDDVVLCARYEKDETIMKTGERLIIDPHAITLIFKKIEGHWKLIYSHDSGIPISLKSPTPAK